MALDGKYNFKADSAMGVFEGTVTFSNAEAGPLQGTIEVMDQTVELADGVADGDTFKGVTEVKGPMGKMKLKVSGKVEGDDISGSLDAGLIKMKFEGTRA